VVSVSRTIWRMAGIMLEHHRSKEREHVWTHRKSRRRHGRKWRIGLGMARGLAQCGATVVLAGRNAVKSVTAVQALAADGLSADAVEADVTNEAAVARLFQEFMLRHGRLDILVNKNQHPESGARDEPGWMARGGGHESDQCPFDFITGAAIPVDGGYSIS
jgi:hypothetical protein